MERLVTDYSAGTPVTELMRQYNIGKGTVLGILDEAGVIRKQRLLSAEQAAEAADPYRQGWPVVGLGERTSRSTRVRAGRRSIGRV